LEAESDDTPRCRLRGNRTPPKHPHFGFVRKNNPPSRLRISCTTRVSIATFNENPVKKRWVRFAETYVGPFPWPRVRSCRPVVAGTSVKAGRNQIHTRFRGLGSPSRGLMFIGFFLDPTPRHHLCLELLSITDSRTPTHPRMKKQDGEPLLRRCRPCAPTWRSLFYSISLHLPFR